MKKCGRILVFILVAAVFFGCAGAPNFDKMAKDQGVIMPAVMFGEKAEDVHDSASYQFGKPKAIACDAQGNIYSSSKSFDLSKFSPEGEFIMIMGERGEGPGQWKYPKGLAVNSKGELVLADAKLNKVLVLDMNGKKVLEFGQSGEGEADFTDIGPCAVDAQDNIYVSDDGHGVMVFSSDGMYMKTLAAPVDSDKGTREMGYLAIDSDLGVLYVADDGEGEVDAYNLATGEYMLTMGGHGENPGQFAEDIEGLCVGPYHLVFAMDENAGKIHVYQPDGTHVTSFGNAGIYEGEFADAEGLAYDALHNRVVVADEKNYRIQSIDLSKLGL